jgi:hypothetical protein
MAASISKSSATPDAVLRHLKPLLERGPSLSWAERLRIANPKEAGEVRRPSDWDALPRDYPVRVCALVESEAVVIRWATERVAPTHWYLVGRGDKWEAARSGYVTIRGAELVVSG